MEIRVKVPQKLASHAQARGLPVEAYVEEILARQVASSSAYRKLQTKKEIRAWLDSLVQFSDRIPSLPDTISRDWI